MQNRKSTLELGWDHLRFALEAQRAGSVAKAALALGVDETTVGRRLDALEREVGEPLFVRARGSLRATDRGRDVAETAAALEEQVLALGRRLTSSSAAARRVRLAMTEVTAVMFVREGDLLRARLPDVDLELRVGNAVADLGRDADLALRLVKPTGAGLRARRLGRFGFGLYASHAYCARTRVELGRDALAGHDVVLASGEIGRSPEGQWLQNASNGARVRLSTASLLVVAAALEAGLGLGVLPRHLGDVLPTLRKVTDLPEIPSREAWLVMHEDLRKSRPVRLVAEAIEAIFVPRFQA